MKFALTKPQLEKFHAELAKRLAPLTRPRRTIVAGPTNWSDFRAGAPVAFELVTSDFPEKTSRERGDPQQVYPLLGEGLLDPTYWFGWHEEWLTSEKRMVELVGASIAFYWGFPSQQEKTQILRAEWDSVVHRGGHAGQPHWHFDREQVLFAESAQRPIVATGEERLEELEQSREPVLEELTSGPTTAMLRTVSFSGMHLPMAGWSSGSVHPACWQLAPSNYQDIVEWAERVLSTARQEFQKFKTLEQVSV